MSLLAACVQPNTSNFYFNTSGGSGAAAVSSIANGGNLIVSTASGITTITNSAVLTLTAAATANGLSVTPSTGVSVVSYTAPTITPPPTMVALPDALTFFGGGTIAPGATLQLFNWSALSPLNLTQVLVGIVGSNTNSGLQIAYNTSGALTGIPSITFWVGQTASLTPPVPYAPGQSLTYQDDLPLSGFITIDRNQKFVYRTTPAESTTTAFYFFATNSTTGNSTLTLTASSANFLWEVNTLNALTSSG